jgi:hypothetical protein
MKSKYSHASWNKGKAWTPEMKKKLSDAHKGYVMPEAQKEKIRQASLRNGNIPPSFKGKKRSLETIQRMRESKSGEKNPMWKGGITPMRTKIYHSLEYKLWRKAVFDRDKYTCVWCGDNRGGNLEADHIKPFAYYPELRFAIDNGRTLCHECHTKTETYLNRWYKKHE